MGEIRQKLFPHHDPYTGLELLPFNNHGWASNSPAFKVAIDECKPKLIIEVGTWFGGSARTMASLIKDVPGAEVVCVDTFLGSLEHWNRTSYLMTMKNGRPTIYEQFLSNSVHAGLQDIITPFPCDSINAFEILKSYGVVADLIYIDAGHDYESVKADLLRWPELVRVGGMILLDDAHHPPIQKAAGEIFGINPAQTCGGKFLWKRENNEPA